MANKEVLTNFIPVGRTLFEHPFWIEERVYSKFEAWIYLLKEARFEDTKLLDGNKIVKVNRGQIYASVRFISNALKWPTKRTLNFLKLLENEKMIKRETVKETGQSLITICNYDKYNNLEEKKKQQMKRNGNSRETKSNTVNTDNIIPPNSPPSDDVAEKTWRDDFKIYLSEVTEAYNALSNDLQFIKEREKYHPNLNISLSLEKSFKDYWSTEVAWKKRKRSHTKELDWKATFRNSLDQKFNHVYKTKSDSNEQSKPEGRLHPALRG